MTTADDPHFEGTHIIEPVGIRELASSYFPLSFYSSHPLSALILLSARPLWYLTALRFPTHLQRVR
jgi:hypothetical protein